MLPTTDRARRGALITAILAIALLTGACGSKSSNASKPALSTTTTAPSTTSTATTDGLGRSQFSLAVGKLCPPFYGDTNVLQNQLSNIPVTAKTGAADRKRAADLLSKIQQRSERFVLSLAAVPKPVEKGALANANALIASLTRFAGYQRGEANLLRRSVLKSGTSANTTIPGKAQIDKLLARENARLAVLLKRLDVPECQG